MSTDTPRMPATYDTDISREPEYEPPMSLLLLDELQERGFTPHESGRDWFDLEVGIGGFGRDGPFPRAKIRVTLVGTVVDVYVLTSNDVGLWDVRLSDNTPLSVVTTVLDLAIARALTDS